MRIVSSTWVADVLRAVDDEAPTRALRCRCPVLVAEGEAVKTRGRAAVFVVGGLLVAAFLSPVEAASAPTYAATATATARHPVIAFSTGYILVQPDLDNPSQVMTVRPDGTGEHQLTHVPEGKQAGAPDISPDGRTIAYVSNQDGDNFAV